MEVKGFPIEVSRYHDISYGHRIMGVGKCNQLHGHNARVTVVLEGRIKPDEAMLIDFSKIKDVLFRWLDDTWDHKCVLFVDDPLVAFLKTNGELYEQLGISCVGFHPSSENMALYFRQKCMELLLANQITNVDVCEVTWQETRKCSVTSTTPKWWAL